VGDVAGFAAATYLRGVPVVQVPTTLLAMVDAAIGGKVAVNHREAKNLIGAFYQPHLVLSDVSLLRTLPVRELNSGWAEVIKHAFIADERLLAVLEEHSSAISELEAEIATDVIRRSVAIKAAIVSEDEREETGRRTILNYGHTVGHALETATHYSSLLHGEAVAVGMMVAARLSERLELIPSEVVERQRRLLERFGLPTSPPEVERSRLLSAMSLDKKVNAGNIRWVLLEGIGKPVIRGDVPERLVADALEEFVS